MRPMLLCAAAAVAVIATPAAARDNSAYFGLEVGAIKVKDTDVEVDGFDLVKIDHKTGVDGDMIAGYDFGMFRLEGELAYKRTEHDTYDDGDSEFDADGRTSVYSGMVNAQFDIGDERDINFYAGAGAGYAQIIHSLEDGPDSAKIKDRGFAWQIVAGVRKSIDRFFDVGLKYRYFDGGNVEDEIDGDRVKADYKSHSLLLSLIHNFNTPSEPPPPPYVAPPPPPPAPPPATQMCPDGSVVLATDPCPLPPPPPPPPPPEPERG